VTYRLGSDTKYTHIDTQQYELMGKKLGRDGIRRVVVVATLAIGAPWVFLMFWLVGSPFTMLWLYVIPPGALVMLLTRPDRGGRLLYLALYDRALYLARRHRRVIPQPGRGHRNTPLQSYTLQPALIAVDATKGRKQK